jgi:PBP1b-binding outer membrane lipoprotein LpoB
MKLLSTIAILAISLSACVANPPKETAVRKTTTTTTTNEVLVDDNNFKIIRRRPTFDDMLHLEIL